MQKLKAFEFGELRFTKRELRSLDKRIFSLIVGSSIAANDVAILQRLVVFHGHGRSSSEIVQAYSNINNLVLLRLLAAKIYEYIHFIDGFATKIKRRPDPALGRFLAHADKFLELKRDPEFAAIRDFRDNVTHHYHGATEIANLNPFPDEHVFSIILHESSGNSLSPLGEDIGTFGMLNSRTDGVNLDRFAAWTIKASGKVTRFQQRSLILILEQFFPAKKLKMRKVAVEHRMVGDEDTLSPVLFSTTPLTRE